MTLYKNFKDLKTFKFFGKVSFFTVLASADLGI